MTKRRMIPLLCIFIGAVITMVAAYFDYTEKLKDKQEQLENEKERSQQYKDLATSSNELIKRNNEILNSQKTVIKLQGELEKKNEKIRELQSNIFNNITGGNNIPYLTFTIYGGKGIKAEVINDDDKLPLRDIIIDFHEVFKEKSRDSIAIEVNANSISEQILFVSPQRSRKFYDKEYDTLQENVNYQYTVSWPSGSFSGRFNIKINNQNNISISHNEILSKSKGLKLFNAVSVNGVFASNK